jgi:S-adenosylmethionine hydrolase
LLGFTLALSPIPAERRVIALLTDFGYRNEAVGICHGAILAINSDLVVVDYCHEVDPYNIRKAALILKRSASFPKGTIFVGVVDPGVGTTRAAIAIRTQHDRFYIAPNNGLLSEVIREQGITSTWQLDAKRINPDWSPGTFDGRDLFCPAAAILADASGDLERIGHPLDPHEILMLPESKAQVLVEKGEIIGHYLVTDEPYGNIWTDITPANLTQIGLSLGAQVEVQAGNHHTVLPLVVSFGHVSPGAPLAYLGSGDTLALAINMGDLRKEWALQEGAEIRIRKYQAAEALSTK